MKRSESREQAFMIVFEMCFHDDRSVSEIINGATVCRELKIDEFARALAQKTGDMRILLDDIINKYSAKWKVERLSTVALTLLRMGICEILYTEDVPTSVTINEAVELAKKYGSDEDAPFVNGVLGAFVRDKEGKSE